MKIQEDQKDKAWLEAYARVIQTQVRKTPLVGEVKFSKIGAENSETYGWSTEIASKGNVHFELWLDKYTNRLGERHLYFSVYIDGRQTKRILDFVSQKVPNLNRKISNTDKSPDEDGESGLDKIFSADEYGEYIYEFYTSPRRGFLGVYLKSLPQGRRRTTTVKRIVAFYLRMYQHIFEEREISSKVKMRIKQHAQKERDSSQSEDRKQKDHYICAVCGFDFKKVYGKIGLAYAEAHHKVPLSKLRQGAVVLSSDLVTLCANCHRMAHRVLSQKPGVDAISFLRKKFK